jgi:hypothetical protein
VSQAWSVRCPSSSGATHGCECHLWLRAKSERKDEAEEHLWTRNSGGNVSIMAGVTIGRGCTVGA